jgi:membrane peptidoglycan carboxypeptidase
VVAVTLGAELGPPEVAGFARRLGIESPLRPYLSLSLGTSEIHPLELAAVYGTFANGGLRAAPFGVVSVRAADGRLIYRARPSDNRVIRPSTAFLLTQALTDVFGPGGTARGLNPGRPAAGKTGTSDGNRDAWFAGYTPDLTAVVQIGYDQGRRSLPGSGGTLAAPIWSDFVRRALHNTPARAFTQPGSVHTLLVCAETGELATPVCPAKAEFFVGGTEPSTICSRHRTVRMLVCRRSRLLPGLNCKHLETVDFHPGEEPAEICHLCKGGLLDWLDNLFKSPARPRGERNGTAGPVEEHGILAPGGPPEGGERRRGWR